MEVLLGGVLQGRGAMGGIPNGGMGHLVRLGKGKGFIKLPVFPVISDRILGPGFQNNLQRLVTHLPALFKGGIPAHEFMFVGTQASAEVQAAPGQIGRAHV